MNFKFKNIIKNFSYTFTSSLITMLISTLVVLIVPKVIGIEQYGYWQLYIFYSTYIGFLNIGWVEGIYLRYGGYDYNELDKKLFSTQFIIFIIYNFVITALIIIISSLYINDLDTKFIFFMLAICIMLVLPRGFLQYLLQSTNRIKEYSKIVIIDRVIYFINIILILIIRIGQYKVLIAGDLIAKGFSLFIAIYVCKDIIFSKVTPIKYVFDEIKENIVVGFKLMIANISSMLIIGIVRFGIERRWNIETFAKVSLTMSVSNLLMTFINAIGIIIFPMLRRTSEDRLPEIYSVLRTLISVPLLLMLAFYYPFKIILSEWLPQYKESLSYMALLFPMCLYESKMAMLVNTYLKATRKEKYILFVNVLVVIISVIITVVTIFVFNNIELAVLSIVFLLALRCILAEKYLAKILKIDVKKDIVLELVMTIIFIFTSWTIRGVIGSVLYTISCIIYLFLKRNDILISKNKIVKYVKEQ